jgi:beta-lactam-binding protein with PASTA domain
VPKVVRRRLAVAKRMLRRANCRAGRISWRYSAAKPGIVIAQQPHAGWRRAANARVNLLVSRGRKHK